jgi:carboxyl-terminal processing protease
LLLLAAVGGLAVWCAACATDQHTALVLDVFDLVDRYYIEKVDQRELVGNAFVGLLDRLKADARFQVQSDQIKKILEARERGENVPLPTPPEATATPIPTRYDKVVVKINPTQVDLRVGGQIFQRALENDKRRLCRTLLDGIAFLGQTLGLKETPDKLLHMTLDAMVQKLDPHSGFLDLADYNNLMEDTQGTFGGVGIEIGMRAGYLTVIAPIEGGPAARAGVQSKDRIVSIDHVETLGQTLLWAVQRLRGVIGQKVLVTVKRAGAAKPLDFEITRERIQASAIKSKRLPGDIGYIQIIQFNARTSTEMDAALAELHADAGGIRVLVLDVRNNPGGLLDQVVNVADKFLPGGLIVDTIGRGLLQDHERFASGRGRYTQVPMVVIVNGGSASASEILAGALKDHRRALIVGAQTFGKGSVQTIFDLRNDTGLRLTTALYYTPSHTSIQAFGITPNIRFNLPAKDEEAFDMRESVLEGHLKNREQREPPKPEVETDIDPIYKYFVARHWIAASTGEPSDEADFLLAFVKKLLAGSDLSVNVLIERGRQLIAQTPAAARAHKN